MFALGAAGCYADPCPNCNGQGTCSKQGFTSTCTCTTDWTPTSGSSSVCTVPPFTSCAAAFQVTQLGYSVQGLNAGVAAKTTATVACAPGYVVEADSSISPATVTCLAAGGVYSASPSSGFSGCVANATCPPIVIANSALKLDGDLCSSTGTTFVDQQCVFQCSDPFNINPATDPSGVFCRADGTYSGQPTGCGVPVPSASTSSTGSSNTPPTNSSGKTSAAAGQITLNGVTVVSIMMLAAGAMLVGQ